MSDEDDEDTERRVKRRTLSRKERDELEEIAEPGAVYRESTWRKRSHESLESIRRAVDRLDRPGGTRGRRARPEGDLPAGLRSRITDALGPVAYVQRAYSTKRHHVCHVGLRDDGHVEDLIVLVGPESVRRFEDVSAAVDAIVGPIEVDVDTPTEPAAGTDDEPEPLDVADGDGEDPFGYVYEVHQVEGIGETYREELAEHGIETTRDLWHADARELADALDVSATVVANWQLRTELMAVRGIGPQYAELLVRSGVHGLEDLRSRETQDLLEHIRDKQDELQVRIQKNVIQESRVEAWIEAAREHDPGA